ncbi:acetylglucosaminyltransferase [Volvox carteri f. nagariensis]|uniref:Acetylglucosaminyltransferase n=1 Tax=Volvox carteri f. nagariensis TaxID=3068 RepID=D8TV33_VOLCA|nr:acetylglucosaminyltransferase [Volvox carteri f. nagariensis]EFJ48508.1 acetylglucosaminyltransferase [Volvox carteri f. nagariensis]|eukprot:XP_002950307.1 acetylglucosaminyltransferase [Volvox carteri f. nagariensis]
MCWVVRSRTEFKIYMYELPWEIAFPYELGEDVHTRDNIYTAYEEFMKYFLVDDMVRTQNPYEANLFYVPALTYFYATNVRNGQWQAEAVIEYIRTKWPFYNRTGGRDHFVFFTGDRASCHFQRWIQDSVIKVVHFGMQHRNLTWNEISNRDYACIQNKRDLVVPPRTVNLGPLLPSFSTPYYKWLVSNQGYDGNRTLLFFFAGGVADGEYSGGVRLAIKQMLSSITHLPADVKFVEGRVGGGEDEYFAMIRASKFCIAPYGHGWGNRLVQAVHLGCVPVIIQDYVYQAFEDFLPYEDFSVRMRLADVPHMIDLLRSYSEADLARLRLGLARYYRAFIWEREYDGLAYEWTLAGLQRRAYNLAAEYFHR